MKKLAFLSISASFIVLILFVSSPLAGNPRSVPFLPNIPKIWTEITEFDTEYLGMDLFPSCSGFPGKDSEFYFFAKGGTVNNLVIFFDGGGACWDSTTCLYLTPYTQEIDETAEALALAGGIFDNSNPNNPFKDWSFVYIPYCTGDIHWGSNDKEYLDIYGAYGGESITIHHRGFDNALVVLNWITENFRKPHKIFVTGSSAGAYGAIGIFPWIKEAYSNSQVYVLADAGMGVTPEEFQIVSRENWNVQLPPWIFDGETWGFTTPEIWRMIADYYPHCKLAEFTNVWDMTQTGFYYLTFLTLELPPPADPCIAWYYGMIDGVNSKSEAHNYRYYIAAGTDHTIIWTPEFYTEASAGISLSDWVKAMVKSQGGTHGHGGVPWESVECEMCGPPLFPCPIP